MHNISDDGTVIRVTGAGFYVEHEVRDHFKELAAIIACRRQAARQVLAIIDLREAVPQASGKTTLISDSTNRLYSDPSDRVAIVVSSSLLKMQLRRVHQQQGFGIFTSFKDAEKFLMGQADSMQSSMG